ncbi:MAG: type II/IV secretion system protein [Balneolaceae bacterium]|nr:MAG: type II/IV secretion system protein [Balneolaceae bacterium]
MSHQSVSDIETGLTRKLTDTPVVSQVNSIFNHAIEKKASDIHIELYEHLFRVRLRLDGVLKEEAKLSLFQKDSIISRIKIMANLDIAEKRRPQDGRIRFNYQNNEIDLRVSTLPTGYGEKVVLRILDKSSIDLNLHNLGFEAPDMEKFVKNIHLPYGMILVTGPTGSGKTTTLYGALNELNSEQVNITTIEDPVEYDLQGINQTQVNSEIGLTFSKILRSILRQDPNIIMLGEIRDGETAEIATRAALTGHMVLSTLHTNDAPSALTRLIDLGVEPFLAASSIRLIVAQRLVRKICTNCNPVLKTLHIPIDAGLEGINGTVQKGSGCIECNCTGYKGRVALFEILEINQGISELIAAKSSPEQIKNAAIKAGMTSLRESGIKKIKAGLTTPEEVLRETSLLI